jgi:hypothetical protein
MKTAKRFLIATALAVAAHSQAAVHLSVDGHGQVLLFPYYTAQRDNQTLIALINSTSEAKALKIRFLEGINSRTVMEFNLYLAPEDVWTAGILASAPLTSGDNTAISAAIASFDSSCTVPQFAAVPGQNLRLKGFVADAYIGARDDGGPQSFDRTREGHIEVIEMASIPANTQNTSLFARIGAGAGGCTELENAWLNSNRADPFPLEVMPPSGGIYGAAAILDLNEGSYINYDANAIDGFRNQTLHTAPDSNLPNLSSAEPASSVYFVGGKAITARWGTETVGPNLSLGQRIDAVSSVLMTNQLEGEWNAELELDAASEWVISFPTKKFYTDRALVQTAVAPFQALATAEVCDNGYDSAPTNRSGIGELSLGTTLPGFPQRPPLFCFSTNVLTFKQANNVNGSRILRSALARAPRIFLGSTDRNGKMQISFTQNQRPSLDNQVNNGLPAIGFWALQILNRNVSTGQAPRNYGGAYSLKRFRRCTIGGGGSLTSC